MRRDRYPWKRFWVPRDGTVRFSETGYLEDPDGPDGRLRNPDAVPFDKIADVSCLALLGEPGIGKTDALKVVVAARREAIGPDRLLQLDLRSYGNEDRLCRDLFESPQFANWVNSTDILEIFLDSLDESLVHTRTAATLLVDQFKRYPTSRLKLRIACRAADWPRLLDEELSGLWGPTNFAVYELLPLRRIDLVQALTHDALPPENFLAEVERHGVVPLAIVPVTFQFLLREFAANLSLPNNRIDLYHRGCLALCREPSASREASDAVGDLSGDQRLSLAERIAAVTMFSKRVAVVVAGDDGEAPDGATTVTALAALSDFADGEVVDSRPAAIREALGTGLFTQYGPGQRGWMHWTFAEFLAARWAVTRDLTPDQMYDLITVRDVDDRVRVVPQLHETAAWLAGMTPELVTRILEEDPQVLFHTSPAHLPASMRGKLTASLLHLMDSDRMTDDDIELRRAYAVLDHPSLSSQLEPYITDKGRNIVVRRVAIDIAEACNLNALTGLLVDVALDASEAPHIRAQSIHAVGKIGSVAERDRLRPLLDGQISNDGNDEIKGSLLSALSGQLCGGEIFRWITLPKNPNLLGAYRYFVSYEFPSQLKVKDLPAALSWIADQPREVEIALDLRPLCDAIFERAVNALERPEIAPYLARAVAARLQHHDKPLGEGSALEQIQQDSERRHRLLLALVPLLLDEERQYDRVGLAHCGIVVNTDVSWLVARLLEWIGQREEEVWAELVCGSFDSRTPGQYDLVFDAVGQSVSLANRIGGLFRTVEIGSPEATRLKTEYEKRMRWQRPTRESIATHPPLAEIAESWLNRFEEGEVAAWWRLNLDLTLSPDSDQYPPGGEFEADLTRLPGWLALDENVRRRCLRAAERYLRLADPGTSSWLGTNVFHRPAAAGYRALRLLLGFEVASLEALPTNVWAKWAPIILAYPESNVEGEERATGQLVALAYGHTPEELLAALWVLIDKDNADHGAVFVTRKLTSCWDGRLVGQLLAKLRTDAALKPAAFGQLLSDCLAHDREAALKFALSTLSSCPAGEGSRDRAIEAGVAILVTRPSDAWPQIRSLLDSAPELGRDLFLKFAHQPPRSLGRNLVYQFPESSLADLYLWLEAQFPHAEDPRHEGVHYVGPREGVADFRDGILRVLIERGTPEAVSAIRRLAAQLPHLPWLKYSALRAKKTELVQSWDGVSPEELFRLTKRPEGRLVEGGDQLLDAVTASLGRLQSKFQGETPAVVDLWNDNFAPKDESHLADYVRRHLAEDLSRQGIVVNREIRIRPGELTDIHVDAIRRSPRTGEFDTVSVIVEVKGCWNKGVKVDMERQLKNRYLRENQCRYGLYLVGWFPCRKWIDDYRIGQTPKWTLQESHVFFERQAKDLSDERTTLRAVVLDLALR